MSSTNKLLVVVWCVVVGVNVLLFEVVAQDGRKSTGQLVQAHSSRMHWGEAFIFLLLLPALAIVVTLLAALVPSQQRSYSAKFSAWFLPMAIGVEAVVLLFLLVRLLSLA